MIIFELRNFGKMVQIFLAAVVVPSFLVRFRPDKGQGLFAVWTMGLRLLFKQTVHTDCQRSNGFSPTFSQLFLVNCFAGSPRYLLNNRLASFSPIMKLA